MITLEFVNGESKTGIKRSEYSHWYANAEGQFDGVGDTPLDAVMALAQQMYEYMRDHTS